MGITKDQLAQSHSLAKQYVDAGLAGLNEKINGISPGDSVMYDPNKTYLPGETCIYNGNVWKNTSGSNTKGVAPESDYNVWNVGFSNPNLIDNPWFTVNQRGQSIYVQGANIYTVDRWIKNTDSEVQLTDGKIILSNKYDTAKGASIIQYLPYSIIEKIESNKFTLSILTGDGEIFSTTGKINNTSGYGNVISYYNNGAILFQWNLDTQKNTDVSFRIGKNSFPAYYSESVKAVKLELGPISTLANDAPPNYGIELMKCRMSMVDPNDTYANGYNPEIETLKTEIENIKAKLERLNLYGTLSGDDTLELKSIVTGGGSASASAMGRG